MSKKSYQTFILEQKDGKLVVSESAKGSKWIFYLFFVNMLILNVLIIYYTTNMAAALGSILFLFVCFVILISQLLSTRQKKEYVFHKTDDLIFFNGRKLMRLSAISYVEVYVFLADEASLESYRVLIVSEVFNRKFRMYEVQDEYDMRRLAEALSEFLDIPIVESKQEGL